MWRLPIAIATSMVLGACAVRSQPSARATSDWTAVMALPVNEQIEVTTKDGRSVRGVLVMTDRRHITLNPGSVVLLRDEVRRLFRIQQGDDALLNGMVIGAVAGGVGSTAALVGQTGKVTPSTEVVVPLMSVPIGMTAGALVDRAIARPRRTLVYAAP